MKDIGAFFQEKDRLARHLGIELVAWEKGRARARMSVEPHHLNGVGVVHGGALFTLADVAFAVASNSHGTLALGINANIAFVKSSRGGVLEAEAVEVAINPKLATYEVKVNNEAGELLAVFQGTVYRKKALLRELMERERP